MIKKVLVVSLFCCLAINSVFAFDVNGNKDKELMKVAKSILPSTEIQKVMPTEMPNVLAVLLANEEIIYIYPPKKLILIGEIYNSDGVSLSDKHLKAIGAKPRSDDAQGNKPLDISPLFEASIHIKDGDGKYGFIVFTDPDCPFCKQLDQLLSTQNVTVDYIYTPIDSLHPNARAKAVSHVMKNKKMTEDEAKKFIANGEHIATGLGLNGTPQTIIYEKEGKKPINGITGADPRAFAQYLPKVQ